MSNILKARLCAGLRQYDVARPMRKSCMWLSYVERGRLPLDPETEARILALIARLSQLNEAVAESKQKLIEDFATR